LYFGIGYSLFIASNCTYINLIMICFKSNVFHSVVSKINIPNSKPSNTTMYISQVFLIYKFNRTTCFGLEDHLQVLRAKVYAMLRWSSRPKHVVRLNLYIRNTCDIYSVVFDSVLLVI
jgi:hypothetical protein